MVVKVIPEKDSTLADRRKLEKQELFLSAFRRCGTVRGASQASGVSRTTCYAWEREDALGFSGRWEQARHSFRELLEEKMYARLDDPAGNRGSDVLMMFALKGVWPDKYKDNMLIVDDTAKDLLARLRGREPGGRDNGAHG
jgi:hypothetical protein